MLRGNQLHFEFYLPKLEQSRTADYIFTDSEESFWLEKLQKSSFAYFLKKTKLHLQVKIVFKFQIKSSAYDM